MRLGRVLSHGREICTTETVVLEAGGNLSNIYDRYDDFYIKGFLVVNPIWQGRLKEIRTFYIWQSLCHSINYDFKSIRILLKNFVGIYFRVKFKENVLSIK